MALPNLLYYRRRQNDAGLTFFLIMIKKSNVIINRGNVAGKNSSIGMKG